MVHSVGVGYQAVDGKSQELIGPFDAWIAMREIRDAQGGMRYRSCVLDEF